MTVAKAKQKERFKYSFDSEWAEISQYLKFVSKDIRSSLAS